MSFSPAAVPEVAAGYWWDAELGVTDPGQTTFRWLEQNGKTSADQVQATSSRPTPVSIRIKGGGTALRWDQSLSNAPPGTGTRSQSASTVTAGWTGATYVCGWWRLNGPLAALTNSLFQHGQTGAARLIILSASATTIQLILSANGTVTNTVTFPHFSSDAWHFVECLFVPSAASGSRGEMWVDRVQRSSSAGGITVSSLFDATALVCPTARSAVTEHGYVTDCVWCAYANGIPSAAARDRLCGYKRPIPAVQSNGTVGASRARGSVSSPGAAGTITET